MQIPDTVTISGIPFVIRKVTGASILNSKYAAYIDYNGQTITIDIDRGSATQAISFLHEAVHGMMYALGMDEHDEKLVDGLAHQLYLFITSNSAIFQENRPE